MGPRLPGLTVAAQKSWKGTGMLADVAACGRSRKWGCRGRLAQGLKPRSGSHEKVWNPVALGFPLPGSLGTQKKDVAAMQSSPLVMRKHEGETLQEGNG